MRWDGMEMEMEMEVEEEEGEEVEVDGRRRRKRVFEECFSRGHHLTSPFSDVLGSTENLHFTSATRNVGGTSIGRHGRCNKVRTGGLARIGISHVLIEKR
jgi:hypothetical protein